MENPQVHQEQTQPQMHAHQEQKITRPSGNWNIAKWIILALVAIALIWLYNSGMMGKWMMDNTVIQNGTGATKTTKTNTETKTIKPSPGKRMLQIRKDDTTTTTTTTVGTTGSVN